MHTFINQVAEFADAFQVWTPGAPDLSDSLINKLRPALIREEIIELHEAIKQNDRVQILDALCDTQYVISGAALAWGFRRMLEGTVDTIDLRKIHDMDSHIAGMLGMTFRLETSAQLVLEMQTFTLLRDLQSRLTKCVFHFGFSPVFEDAFAAVHASNMSKIWKAGDMITECFAEDDTHTPTVGGYIVQRADGKIKKPQSYSPAELGRFV